MDEKWAFLVEAFNDVEADIIGGLLEANGIPVRKESNSFTGAMRVIGGQAYEIQVLVPEAKLGQARKLLQSVPEK